MATPKMRLIPVLALIFVIALVSGCGGGGGGGGSGSPKGFNGGSWESDFFVQDMLFGRPLFDGKGMAYQVVNPATYVELDPITGFLLPGYPKLLFPGDQLGNLWSLDLIDTSSQPFKPKIIPRNAALVVDFSQPVDPDSLNLDSSNMLTPGSPIQVQDKQGRPVPIQVDYSMGDLVILNPVVGDNVGFPASPAIFDENGVALPDPEGYMKIVFYSMGTGPSVLKSASGLQLGARFDGLGTPQKPVGFNPGNRYLDFLSFGEEGFNGFLPDLNAPRIIREVRHEGTVDGVTLSGSSYVIEDSTADFNIDANDGQGEWAGAILTIRPGAADETKLRVATNSATAFYVSVDDPGLVLGVPQVGDAYLVQRVEYFEPIPGFERPETAIDPENHPKDPNDPEDAFNSDLIRFLKFDEWDGQKWVPVTDYDYSDPDHPIGARYRISLQFSEPMDIDSFRPYDSFYVADDIGDKTDPLFNAMKLGRVTASDRQTRIYFEPVQTDQFGLLGGDRFVGFGKTAKDLRMVIRIVPPAEVVEAFYDSLGDPATWPPEIIADLEAEGVLGVTDLGGQPLGLPEQFFDKADPYCIINEDSPGRGAFPPAVDFLVGLSCSGDPSLDEVGVVVHRFMGLPETAADPDKKITGVVYRDHDDKDGSHTDNEIYGPHIADVSLGLSGFLSGHPVEFIEHVFDDYNPPPPSSPSYPDPISRVPFGAGTPINAANGVRFQQIYRRGDCSPDVPSFGGTVLDIVGLAWAPIGGNVTHSYIKELSIAMCLSSLGIDLSNNVSYTYDEPDTKESGGIPKHKSSGLKKKYDSYRGTWGPNGPYPAPDNYKEENPPISDSNVYDSDGDGSLRDEWQIVLGSPIDFDKLHADPVVQYTDGRPYVIDQKNVFAPKNQGAQFNYYIAYPDFDNPAEHPGFGYDSSRGLLIDIRTDDNGETPVAITNGYAFHVGIQSSMLPRFRVYSRGSTPTPGTAPRVNVYAATDPFDEISPPKNPQTGAPEDSRSWNRAWDSMLASPGNYGDNSRYFMIFEYAKRVSTVESPLIRVKPGTLMTPEYLSPIVEPPLTEVPQGTNLTIWFRASKDKDGTVNVTNWVFPENIGGLNGGQRPYVQFRATFEANLKTGDIPVVDTLVIPYKK